MPRALSCPYVKGNCHWKPFRVIDTITPCRKKKASSCFIITSHPLRILRHWHPSKDTFARSLHSKERILIATEGINGTLGGSAASARAYQKTMSEHPLFKGMEFKISEYATNPFGKLSVKARKEIVTLGVDGPLDTSQGGGEHLSPSSVAAND